VSDRAAIEADEAWRAAVAALYERTRDERPDALVGGAREDAPVELMARFGFEALTTMGDERDLRWLLPRLVELLASDPDGVAHPDVVAGKLTMAGFEGWPEDERATVRAAFLALWRLWLDGARPWRRPWRAPGSGGGLGPNEILPALAELGVDVAPLLDDLAARARDDRALAEEYVDLAELVAFRQLEAADDPYDAGGRAAPRYFRGAAAQLEALGERHPELAGRLTAVTERLP
jgi:hypothetical protein